MAAIVGQKGQIVIEKSIRDALGITPGYLVVQRVVDDHVELFFFPPEHKRSLRGILASKIKRYPPTQDWSEIQEAAWAQAAVDNWTAKNSIEKNSHDNK